MAAGAIALTGFRLLLPGWLGAVVAWLAVVWVANVYMSLFVRLRLDIKRERVEIDSEERAAAPPSALMVASTPWRRLHERRVERRGRHPYVAIGSRPGSTNQGGPGKDGRPA